MTPAEAETRAGDQPVTIPIGDETVRVPPIWQWPDGGILLLLAEAYDDWADRCLPAAERERWLDADPTLDDCDWAAEAWEQATGQNLDTIARLSYIVEHWPNQLESDLVAHCGGQDLRHLWAPGHGPSHLTWRRLGVLYDGLPGQSLTKTAWANDLGDQKLSELATERHDRHHPWSHTDLLIADLIDAVNVNTWVLMQAHVDQAKRKQIKRPEPVHRPGLVRKRRPKATPQMREVLAYMSANQGALPPGRWKNVEQPTGG